MGDPTGLRYKERLFRRDVCRGGPAAVRHGERRVSQGTGREARLTYSAGSGVAPAELCGGAARLAYATLGVSPARRWGDRSLPDVHWSVATGVLCRERRRAGRAVWRCISADVRYAGCRAGEVLEG